MTPIPSEIRSMRRATVVALMFALGAAQAATAQPAPAPAGSQPFATGPPLKLTSNAKTYGGLRFAESLAHDAERDLSVAVNAGMAQDASTSSRRRGSRRC